jgi:hypothetical protein
VVAVALVGAVGFSLLLPPRNPTSPEKGQ